MCCEANFESLQSFARKDGKMLNVKSGVENIMNSDTYKEIRKQMMNGEIPQSCTKCHKVEQSGGFSKRQFVTSDRTDFTCEEDGTIEVDLKNIENQLNDEDYLEYLGIPPSQLEILSSVDIYLRKRRAFLLPKQIISHIVNKK